MRPSIFYAGGLLAVLLVAQSWAQEHLAPTEKVHDMKWGKISSPEYFAEAVPKGNPQSDEKVQLGELLFNDTRLSSNGKVSCATCHNPAMAFTDGKALSDGVGKTMRNSPTVMNALFQPAQFWDGRAVDLEEQAKLPMTNPAEMALKDGAAAERIVRAIPDYKPRFRAAFGNDEISFDQIVMAIAAFERTKVSTPAPFDRFLAGDERAISDSAKRGWSLFNGQGRCVSCHGMNPTGAFFNDNKFHNIGVAAHKQNFPELAREALAIVNTGDEKQIDELAIQSDKFTELGRFLVTKNPGDVGAFKTPTLRNIMVTGPYMHDGSMNTLWDVMDHYNKGGIANPYLDGGITRLGLSEKQEDDLVAFLATLTSPEFKARGDAELARQRRLSRTKRPERDTELALGKKASRSDAVIAQTKKDPASLGGRPIEKN